MERLEQKLENGWSLPEILFGDAGADIYDFEIHNYTYFLDNVQSTVDLIEGLECLSPLADDALITAQKMNEKDFQRFKKYLPHERKGDGESKIPKKFYPLLIPRLILLYHPRAKVLEVPLGATIIRMIEQNRDKLDSPETYFIGGSKK